MSAFTICQNIEKQAMAILTPIVSSRAKNGQFVTTDKGRLAMKLQLSHGDIIANNKNGELVTIEVKAEQRKTGNLFLEWWSNRSTGRGGWMQTLDACALWYYFLDCSELYEINFQKLKTWLAARVAENPQCYYLMEQSKYEQANDTWGYIVPITDVVEAVGPVRRLWINPREGHLNHETILYPQPLLFAGCGC